MPITKAQAESFVEAQLGGTPDSLTVAQIINTAGISMVNMRNWRYLHKTASDLNIVADQSYVDLPDDVQAVHAVNTPTRGKCVSYVTHQKMLDYRKGEYGNPSGFGYVATLAGTTVDGVTKYRLDLYPTPSEDETGGLTVSYKAGWAAIDSLDSGDNIPIPAFLEPLFFELILVVAKGFEKHDMGNFSPRLAEVRGGMVFADALKTDIAIQPIIGAIPTVGGGRTSGQATLSDPVVP